MHLSETNMDNIGIRLQNYRALLCEFTTRNDQIGLSNHGALTRFAKAGGLSARYLSHVNNGRKNIGNALARQLECGFGKPHGWLDQAVHNAANSQNTQSANQSDFLAAASVLFRQSPVEVQSLLMRFMKI